MVIGQYSAGKDSYAGLQAAGAVTTIVILFLLARVVLLCESSGVSDIR